MYSSEDHAVGLELQIIELVEQRERARVQHRDGDATRIQREIDALQVELADLAEQVVTAPPAPPPEFHDAARARRGSPPAA